MNCTPLAPRFFVVVVVVLVVVIVVVVVVLLLLLVSFLRGRVPLLFLAALFFFHKGFFLCFSFLSRGTTAAAF